MFAARVVEAIVRGKDSPDATGVLRGIDFDTPRSGVLSLPLITDGAPIREELQRIMTRDAGVVRSDESLGRATSALSSMVPSTVEESNLLAVSTALVRAATARCESRGTHTRSDFPESSTEYLGRFVFSGDPAPEFVRLLAAAGTTA